MAELKVEKSRGRQEKSEKGAERERPQSQGLARRSEGRPLFMWRPFEPFGFGPWGLLRRFSEDMNRLFGSLAIPEEEQPATWWPAIEIKQRDKNLIISAQLSGVKKEDVKLEIEDDTLIIQGERKRKHEEEAEGVVRSEWSYGSFCRTIPLPEGADTDNAKAEFKDGVLEVSIPVPEAQKRAREIPIKTAA